ncbi:ATP-binding protein [Streptomyces sp. ISL-22]|uniref:ATP-binding protein n=1 Tax=unclassified Streptomyces TaxID=2593676 RepID=UPI001BE84906|nr:MULTISPECIES: ATP-binding protein [unclassified Streptomyces]MBT2422469.1 ATP-binding protein [Streptomyces sp. ISL-24]MBT2436520.1 ATP-binding protein [Streptomyces sp. ISL-22]
MLSTPSSVHRRLAHWTTEAMAAAVPGLRTSLRHTLEGWHVSPERIEVLLLIGTELLSNAVRHAGAAADRLCVTVTLGGGRLQLEVADGDPRLPCVALDAGAEAESGRGLAIVHFLVCETGGELVAFRVATGKVVRVRIPLV